MGYKAPRPRRRRHARASRRLDPPRGRGGRRQARGLGRARDHRHRPHVLGTQHVARSLRLGGPIACVDGSQIVDLRDDAPLYYRSIVGEDAALLRDVLARHRATTFLFVEDTIVHDAAGEPFAGYVRTWSSRVNVVDRVADHAHWRHERGVVAVVALGAEAEILAAVREIEARLPHAATVVSFPVGRSPCTRSWCARPGRRRGPPSSGSRATTAARRRGGGRG